MDAAKLRRVRYLSTLLVLLLGVVGCQGPISDWPQSGSGSDSPGNVGGTPIQPGPPAGGGAVRDAGAGGSVGGTTAGTTSPIAPGSTGGNAGTGDAGGLFAGTADGGFAPPQGAQDAGPAVSVDASAPLDAGVPDAQIPDAQIPDAQVPDAASDGGCVQPSTPDASVCPGYGCRTTLQQLRLALDQEGACTSPQALAVACDGRVSKAALQCTQESAFSLNIERAVSSCLKRDAQLTTLGSDCLDCYVDEALCTLSRCFAACTIGDGAACKTCKRQQCGAPLELCTGLPAP